ncbi:MAG: pilus assembly FimT family protein [Candidatus Methylomirabilales bacterium]
MVGDNRGASLMELFMVGVALVVLVGMAMPLVFRTLEAYRLRGAAWNLAGDLRLARQKAVSLQLDHRICFANCDTAVPAGGYLLQRKVSAGPPAVWFVDVRRADLPDGLTLTWSADAVRYDLKGEASGSTITLTNSAGTYDVVASPSGRVRACKPTCPL